MKAEDIASVAAAVVALTQLVKWGGLPEKAGPLAVLIFAALGVGAWGYSTEPMMYRGLFFTYLSAWIVVATSAAGVFGFTRAAGTAVMSANPSTNPPSMNSSSSMHQENILKFQAIADAQGDLRNDLQDLKQDIYSAIGTKREKEETIFTVQEQPSDDDPIKFRD